jgi:hypothetical protein
MGVANLAEAIIVSAIKTARGILEYFICCSFQRVTAMLLPHVS